MRFVLRKLQAKDLNIKWLLEKVCRVKTSRFMKTAFPNCLSEAHLLLDIKLSSFRTHLLH